MRLAFVVATGLLGLVGLSCGSDDRELAQSPTIPAVTRLPTSPATELGDLSIAELADLGLTVRPGIAPSGMAFLPMRDGHPNTPAILIAAHVTAEEYGYQDAYMFVAAFGEPGTNDVYRVTSILFWPRGESSDAFEVLIAD